MGRLVDWNEFLREVKACTDAIWMEEPDDLRRLRNGIVDSGAGSYGQVFTTLLFAQSELRGLALNACHAVLVCASDPAFSLSHLKIAARAHFTARAGFLNYVGLHQLGDLFQRFLAGLDDIDSKDLFVEVVGALKTYGARLHMWTEHVFPWGLGMHMRQWGAADVSAMAADLAKGRWTPVPYLVK